VTRAAFIAGLRQGLKGLPGEEIAEILTDYEAHFSDGAAAGRSDDQIAAALGDPVRLGQELRAETRLRRWEARRNPGTFLRASAALLPVFHIALLLPVIAALLAFAGIAGWVLYLAGATGLHLIFGSGKGNVLVPSLIGAGLIFGVIGIGTLIALALDSGLRLLGRHVRLNYRRLRAPDRSKE